MYIYPDQNGWEGPDKTSTSGGTDVTPMKLKTAVEQEHMIVRQAGLTSAKFHMILIEMWYECLTSWLIVLREEKYPLSPCLPFVLYLLFIIVPTFIREGIEFLSLEDKVHTFEVGKAMLDKVTYIHVFLWPEMVLSAKRAEVLSSLFICMYSVSIY